MSSRQMLHKIEHTAEDVGRKTRYYASLGKARVASTFQSAWDFLREKESAIASAISREKRKLWH